jgi:ADP-ribose pyrophosphatase
MPKKRSASKTFRLTKTKNIFTGHVFDLREEYWRAPDQRVFRRQTVLLEGAVAIVPFLSPNKIVLVNQFRPAVQRWLLEIPAGAIDPGEAPLAGAKRELQEEVRYGAKYWKKIGAIFVAPGFCNERIVLYKAWGLYPAALDADEDEYLETIVMSPQEVRRAVRSGKICDGKSISALSLSDVL